MDRGIAPVSSWFNALDYYMNYYTKRAQVHASG
jgi:hypothetical protein